MQQTDSGQYPKLSFVDLFLRSCLGKIIIVGIITGIILLIANVTVPSKAKMEEEMNDDIMECIMECQGKEVDMSDNLVRNTMSAFTHADTTPDDDTMDTFRKYNRIEIYHHTFYSTAYLFNNSLPSGTRAGIGLFGMVVPTLDFNDFIMRMAPLRKDYNQRIIQDKYSTDEEVRDESTDFIGDGSELL